MKSKSRIGSPFRSFKKFFHIVTKNRETFRLFSTIVSVEKGSWHSYSNFFHDVKKVL